MEARDRTLPDWFTSIRTGQLRLPRFQRGQEWSHNEIESLLNAVVRDLPAGATLVLTVGDEEPFVSRAMAGAPKPTSKAIEHLLDGQQRLTGLWRAFHDDYQPGPARPGYRYFVTYARDEDTGAEDTPQVRVVGRWISRRGQTYPLWADDPKQTFDRKLIPLTLFRPEDVGDEIGKWCDAATADVDESRALERRIYRLRERINAYNLPFLSLPVGTPKPTALEVFIKMNTSYVRLSPFDIIVAQVEDKTGESLTDLREQLRGKVPTAQGYLDLDSFILTVAALRQPRRPPAARCSRRSTGIPVGSGWPGSWRRRRTPGLTPAVRIGC